MINAKSVLNKTSKLAIKIFMQEGKRYCIQGAAEQAPIRVCDSVLCLHIPVLKSSVKGREENIWPHNRSWTVLTGIQWDFTKIQAVLRIPLGCSGQKSRPKWIYFHHTNRYVWESPKEGIAFVASQSFATKNRVNCAGVKERAEKLPFKLKEKCQCQSRFLNVNPNFPANSAAWNAPEQLCSRFRWWRITIIAIIITIIITVIII